MKNLSEEEFQKTFGQKMIPIDFDDNLLAIELNLTNLRLLEPEGAYKNDINTFEHHLQKTEVENVFFVYVKDLKSQTIDYHILDLNEKYGIK